MDFCFLKKCTNNNQHKQITKLYRKLLLFFNEETRKKTVRPFDVAMNSLDGVELYELMYELINKEN